MLLFASDLDNTLVYSHRLLGPEDAVAVDACGGAPCCYMTRTAYERLQVVDTLVQFVPVTTRSVSQYRRMGLLKKGAPTWAAVCNGGILLRDGEIDVQWRTQTMELVAPALPQLCQAMKLLGCDGDCAGPAALVDDLFVFARTARANDCVRLLAAALDPELVTVFARGQKLYVLPNALNKGLAVRRLRSRLSPGKVLAAGDAALDLPMLLEADTAFVPPDFPAADLLPHVRVLGGARLLFADRVLAAVQSLAKALPVVQ